MTVSAVLVDGVGRQRAYQLHAPIPSVQVPLQRLCLWNRADDPPVWEPLPLATFYHLGQLPSGVYVYAMQPWQLWRAVLTYDRLLVYECKNRIQQLGLFYALDEQLEQQVEQGIHTRRVVLYDACWKAGDYAVQWERWGVGWRQP